MADKIKDRQKKLEKEQSSMMKSNFHTKAEKGFRKAKEDYKKVDPGFKKRKSDDRKIKDNIIDNSMGKSGEMLDEIKTSKREAGRTKLRGGGMSQRGLGRAFMKGGKV